jgi:rod shape-determining protein MreD
MFGKKCGMVVGFICGLLMDIFYGSVLGFYALIYLYIGAANGAFHSIFYQDDIKLPLALIMASDFVYSFVCYVLLFLLRGRFNFLYYLRSIIVPEMFYTIVVTLFLYPCILVLNRERKDSERGERNIV